MLERLPAIILLTFFWGTILALSPAEIRAGGYSWVDEKGVTHFSDEKPPEVHAAEKEKPTASEFKEEAAQSFERRYTEICSNTLGLNSASVTLIDIYIEKLSALQREVGADTLMTPRDRSKLLKRFDDCVPRLFSARETAQRRESYQQSMHDVLEQKMQRFDKLESLVAERLEQRRVSSMAKGIEGAKFYSDLRRMGDNPLKYGMTEQEVRNLWGNPMHSQKVSASTGDLNRVSYPLGIDLYFRDGLLETWGWRE